MQLYWNHTSAWVLSCKFTACLQNTPFEEHLLNTFDVWLQSKKNLFIIIIIIIINYLTYFRSLLQWQWDEFPIEGIMKYFRIKRMAEIKTFWSSCLVYNGFFIKQIFFFMHFFISLFCQKRERCSSPGLTHPI